MQNAVSAGLDVMIRVHNSLMLALGLVCGLLLSHISLVVPSSFLSWKRFLCPPLWGPHMVISQKQLLIVIPSRADRTEGGHRLNRKSIVC